MAHERNARLINEKVTQYLLPGILMAMALQLGDIMNTILVGNYLGTAEMSAIGLVLPVFTLIQTPGYVLGTGGAIAAGIALGQRDRKKASSIFSATLVVTIVFAVVFAVCSPLLSEPLANALAMGDQTLAKPAAEYLRVLFFAGFSIGVGLLMVAYLGMENHPQLATAYLIAANVTDLVLVWLFLSFTPLGIAGAGLAFVLGYLLPMVVFVAYIRSPKRMITFVPRITFAPLKQALTSGLPVLMLMIMTIVKTLGLNAIVMGTLGNEGMAVYTVCESVLLIVEMVTGGVIGIIPNIAGVLYGERDYFGLRSLCNRVLKLAAVATVLVVAAVIVFAVQVAEIFGVEDPALAELMVPALRVFMLCVPAYVWNRFLISYYECIEQTAEATIITVAQNGVILLPAAYFGVHLALNMGGEGNMAFALAYVASEVITVLVALVLNRVRHPHEGFYLLPEAQDEDVLDMSIPASMSEVPQVPREVRVFAESRGAASEQATLVAVACEEMVVNIIKYGGKSVDWIDVFLNVEDKVIMLRIRDNGVPFDPTTYQYDADQFDIHGIQLVRDVATSLSYIRTIDLNNTIVEIEKSSY